MADYKLASSELVIALSSAIGTDTSLIIRELEKQLKEFSYRVSEIRISHKVLEPLLTADQKRSPVSRANEMMNLGNKLRKESNDGAILASAAIGQIHSLRAEVSPDMPQLPRTAFIISGLKHPDEAVRLRETYGNVFFLIAINENEQRRLDHLNKKKNIGHEDAKALIQRDEGESDRLGQHTRGVFELADIHLSLNISSGGEEELKTYLNAQISRMLNLMFGNPFITPTFDEYAMFIAYASGLRSADLGRQVGAAIASPCGEIIATGANDVPKFGGGQYWPDPGTFQDQKNGRDYMRGHDANKREHIRIAEEILDMFDVETIEHGEQWKKEFKKRLLGSSIKYLTEYGRAVHAEMAAILSCSRSGIPLQGATLYCSTFPCHNCAKHIIHAGLRRVVYIEPYPKSKTLKLYDDSVTIGTEEGKVHFDEFVGVGPRRFFDLFSLQLSSGRSIIRKIEDSENTGEIADGSVCDWQRQCARLRFQVTALSYIEKEDVEALKWGSDLRDRQNRKSEEEATSGYSDRKG